MIDKGAYWEVEGHETLSSTFVTTKSIVVPVGAWLEILPGGWLDFQVADDRAFLGNSPDTPDFKPDTDTGLWVFGKFTVSGSPVASWVNCEPTGDWTPHLYGVEKSPVVVPAGYRVVNLRGEVDAPAFAYRFNGREVKPKAFLVERDCGVIASLVKEGDFNHRAHCAFMKGSEVSLRYGEFRNLGPRAKLGRYPIHWHHAHGSVGELIGCSIWQDVSDAGSRFVTIHHSFGLTIKDNVGWKSQGHGIFMEDGDEKNNRIEGNLTIDVRAPEELPNADQHVNGCTAHYWVRQGNTYIGNVAAGSNWDQHGKKNLPPTLHGMIMLKGTNQVLTGVHGFEAFNSGGSAAWSNIEKTSATQEVAYFDLVATHHEQSGFTAWERWNTTANDHLVGPCLLLNGMNELFTGKNWDDKRDNVGQVYNNFGDFEVLGGEVAGPNGVHLHYGSMSVWTNTVANCYQFVDPAYWEIVRITFDSVVFNGNRFFGRGNGSTKPGRTPGSMQAGRILDGFVVTKDCSVNGAPLADSRYSGSWLASYFPDYTTEVVGDRVIKLTPIAEPVPVPTPVPEPEPVPEPPQPEPTPEPTPEPVPEPTPEPTPEPAPDLIDRAAVLALIDKLKMDIGKL